MLIQVKEVYAATSLSIFLLHRSYNFDIGRVLDGLMKPTSKGFWIPCLTLSSGRKFPVACLTGLVPSLAVSYV